jgi:ribosomal protein S18 acetylase RimI-like enzyme
MEVALGKSEDAEVAAELLYETDREFFVYLSNGDRPSLLRLFADEWNRPGSPLNCSFSRVVRDEGQVVGLLVGYTQAEHAMLDFTKMGSTVTGLPPGFLDNLLNVYSVAQYLFPAVPPGAFYVQNLAAAPAHRGRGLGRCLMEEAFERARRQGCTCCHLDVDSQTPAVQFYRRLGMEVLVETRVPALAAQGTPTHFRMVKELV